MGMINYATESVSIQHAMTLLYKLYKLIVILVINLLFLLLGIVITALSLLIKNSIKIKALCSMLWARTNCKMLGLRVSIDGSYRDSQYGFTVCNHVSYLDIFALGSIRPSVFVSKHEVKGWPLLGWLARIAGTIFIDRKSKKAALTALAEMEQMIKQKINIVLFPEGTTSDGYVLREFKSPLFDLPVKTETRVIPVSLKYICMDSQPINTKDAMDTLAWYGDMKLLPHVWKVLGCRRIEVKLFFNPVIDELVAGLPVRCTQTGPETPGVRKLLSLKAYESIKHGLSKIKNDNVL